MILPRGHSYPGHRNCHQLLTAAKKGRKKGVNSWSHQFFSHLVSIHPLHNMPVIYTGWQKSGRTGERGGKKKLPKVTQWVTARRRTGNLVLLNDSPAGYITLSLFPTALPVSFTSQNSPITWKSAENVLNMPRSVKKTQKKHAHHSCRSRVRTTELNLPQQIK